MTAIVVGKTSFRDSYADGNPKFVVRKDMGNGTYQCISQDDLDYNGIERYFSAAQIRSKVEYERRLDRSFASQDDFWERQQVGKVLHYHNGFGQFVRGVVVLDEGKRKLKPTALVGAWDKRDLPKRRPNGEIYYPYHADKVVNGGPDAAWQPNESCVFESNCYRGAGTRFAHIDPISATPIDLTVPDMTREERINASLEQAVDQVRKILEERYQTSQPVRETLRDIGDVVNGVFCGK